VLLVRLVELTLLGATEEALHLLLVQQRLPLAVELVAEQTEVLQFPLEPLVVRQQTVILTFPVGQEIIQ
jgi:hypothetical protein